MLLKLIRTCNACLSDYALTVLLVAIGLWCSIQTDFVQIRYFREGVARVRRAVLRRADTPENGLNVFQALSTAVAAQLGAGNVIGVGAAILLGGPGAVFWMWLLAFLGMATVYAEAVLSIQTRRKPHAGQYQGGPVYYILKAFDGPYGESFAAFFAVAAVLALGFSGAMLQSNAIGAAFRTAFGVPPWMVGLLLSMLCAAVFIGRADAVAAFVERARPVVAALFLLGGVIVLLTRIAYLPAAVWMIFRYAFAPSAIIGGGYGAALKVAVSQGARRGLLSNEAGLGSTSHAYAQSDAEKPHDQGVVAMIAVFFDSFVFLTVNALVIISTLYAPGGILAQGYAGAALESVNRANVTQTAFGTVFGGGFGGAFVAVCLLFLGVSALLRWNAFGRLNMIYLFGRDSSAAYTAATLAFILLGALASSDLVWELSDLFNLLMVFPNVVAIFRLTILIHRATRQADRERPRRGRSRRRE